MDSLNELQNLLPSQAKTIKFIINQVSMLPENSCVGKYVSDTVILSSLLYTISPHAYKFLRSSNCLTLPSISTINRICKSYDVSPTLMESSNELKYVTKKLSHLQENDLTVALLLDEIHLKSFIDYKGGNIVGSSFNSEENATGAHVFMITSLKSNYKDVVSILPVKTLQAADLHYHIKRVIMNLENAGFEVITVITDNHKINRKAMSYFVSPPELKNTYCHPMNSSRPLFYLIDTVHLLKSIRNNWFNQKEHILEFPDFDEENKGGIADVSTLRKIHTIEKGNLLKYGYNLSLKSLYPSSIEKQNVKLALAVFNSNLGVSVRNLAAVYPLSRWEGTSTFICIISRWWEIMNVKTVYKDQRLNNIFQQPMTKSSDEIFNFLNKFLNWLNKWEKMESLGHLTKDTHFALVQTTEGILQLTKYLLNEKKFNYFLPGKAQTDNLEERFSKYRQLSGSTYNITIRQLLETEKKLRLQSLLPLTDDIPEKEEEVAEVIIPDCFKVVIGEQDIENVEDSSEVPLLQYVSGYCSYSVTKRIKCNTCEFLLKNETDDSSEKDRLISELSRGRLTYPTSDVITCVVYVYTVAKKLVSPMTVSEFLKIHNQREVVCSVAERNLPNVFENNHCSKHTSSFLIKIILQIATNIFLNNFVKAKNDNFLKNNMPNVKRKKH